MKKKMRKMITVGAACAVAVAVAVVPGAAAKSPNAKGPKPSALTVVVSSPVTANGAVTVTGNLKAKQSCRKNRTAHVGFTGSGTPVDVTTRPNGDFTATLTAPATAGAYALNVSVDAAVRKTKAKGTNKGKGKKKGHKVNCAAVTSDTPVTVG